MAIFGREDPAEKVVEMAKERQGPESVHDGVISIIGSGMRVTGDCETEGTMRVEGTVKGKVRAGKAVVVGKDGEVEGDIHTQDAVIGGRVNGTIIAESRLELQATCVVDGEIRARRIQLEEGGRVNGMVHTGEVRAGQTSSRPGTHAPTASSTAPERGVPLRTATEHSAAAGGGSDSSGSERGGKA